MCSQQFQPLRFAPGGDRALYVYAGSSIDEAVNDRISALCDALAASGDPAVAETVPAYASLLVHYRPGIKGYRQLCRDISALWEKLPAVREKGSVRTVEIPVCYGARFGPDLGGMERLLGISRDEIIRRHCSRDYRVYMMGFLPGFVYLGGMDETIACPRLSSPRLRIEAGAVGIGGSQTGIYPCPSPGGWRIIGSTPIRLYDPSDPSPTPVKAGDRIRFVPISPDEWYEIRRQTDFGDNRSQVPAKEPSPPSGQGSFSLRILSPGPLTTVQDLGRFGSQAEGMTVSGAMDLHSCRLANRLAGNPDDAAVLEMTLTGCSFSVIGSGVIAFAGADISPMRNGTAIPMNTAVRVRDGDLIETGFARRGCRSYLAVSGGIDVPPVLGSRSVNLKCAIGGWMGRALRSGDILPCGDSPDRRGDSPDSSGGVTDRRGGSLVRRSDAPDRLGGATDIRGGSPDRRSGSPVSGGATDIRGGAPDRRGGSQGSFRRDPFSEDEHLTPLWLPADGELLQVRFVFGPQDDLFTAEAKEQFCRGQYTITPRCDRMGLRLAGPALFAEGGNDILSDGITFGSIQIPADGQPIVLMADHQTTGGYAKIGTVVSRDLPLLAQARPGNTIQFVPVSLPDISR